MNYVFASFVFAAGCVAGYAYYLYAIRSSANAVIQKEKIDRRNHQNPLENLIDEILSKMTEEDMSRFAKEPEDHPGVRFHFTGGMAMRNEFRLWQNDTPLTMWFSSHGIFHGDDRSATIYKALWCRLNQRYFSITDEAEHFRAFWARSGHNPDGSPMG